MPRKFRQAPSGQAGHSPTLGSRDPRQHTNPYGRAATEQWVEVPLRIKEGRLGIDLDGFTLALNEGALYAVGGTIDPADHADTHLPSGSDALATAAPVAITDATDAAGTADSFAKSDHQHGHGDRGGGTLHAEATGATAGFMAAADKTKLDGIQAGAQVNPAWIETRGATLISPAGAIDLIVWRAPFACTVTNVRGYRVGGTGAAINARRNGTDGHLAGDASLGSTDTWIDGGTVSNTAYVAGDKLEIQVVTVSGSPTQIAVQVDFSRP